MTYYIVWTDSRREEGYIASDKSDALAAKLGSNNCSSLAYEFHELYSGDGDQDFPLEMINAGEPIE